MELNKRAGLNLCLPKISASAWNVTVVPRLFGAAPIFVRGARGTPREKRCSYSSRFRATSTTIVSESAFTTDAPTPCNPPDV